MQPKKIPVVRVSNAGATGTPEDFEKRFDRQRVRKAQTPEPQPKLKPIEGHNMQELLERVGLDQVT